MLPEQAILEYKHLYKKIYGIDLSFKEAEKLANDFIQFFKIIHNPIKKEWVEKYERKKK